MGLANTRARLTALYGDEGRLMLAANPQGGVIAEYRMAVRNAHRESGCGMRPEIVPLDADKFRTAKYRVSVGCRSRMARHHLAAVGVDDTAIALILLLANIIGILPVVLQRHT